MSRQHGWMMAVVWCLLPGWVVVGCGADPDDVDVNTPTQTVSPEGDSSPPPVETPLEILSPTPDDSPPPTSVPGITPDETPSELPSGTGTPELESSLTPTPPTSLTPPTSPAPLLEDGSPTSRPEGTPTPQPGPDGTAIPSPTPDWTRAPAATPASTPEPTPAQSVWTCPEEMAEIFDEDGLLLLCFDRYECSVDGEMGSADQYAEDAIPTTATSFSAVGVIPSTQISYDQAVAACANTPVYDGLGNAIGYKRLATSDQWRDACDGQVGDGGNIFCYGNTFDDSVCATLDAQGNQVYDGIQETGSFPGCISDFGIYDLLGNAWEWADSGIRMDIEAWFALATSFGMQLDTDDADLLMTAQLEDADVLSVEIAGVQPNTVSAREDGYLLILGEQVSPDILNTGLGIPTGYLRIMLEDASGDPANFLPVALSPVDPEDGATNYYLQLLWEANGLPVPDKRGGAYYTGWDYRCLDDQMVHFHSFDGTISFRCVSDPIPASTE